ncbi:maleylpyruvate isomerase family mycothiol-dependent enzyme [Pedococcus sp. NPDC057267]|uniref:maleylpyruvate isomerase family mycothiol-dependent enzyme n=1 Tax=Pedococcus sp. NPDC057267 TaxID=3346077 RepID=UPI003633E710
MTDLQERVPPTLTRLADLLDTEGAAGTDPADAWGHPSLCEGWTVAHVVAHVTMPARLTPEQWGAEMAAAGGDFGVLSNTVAARDSALPRAELLEQLRSARLHAWQPPGGGAAGALSHAVIHSLDVTVALGVPTVAPQDAVVAVLDAVVATGGSWFGVDLSGVRLEASDADWSWGSGEPLRAPLGELVSLVSGRTLPDGRSLPRR